MKAAKLTILLIVILVLLNWMRGDYDHSLPEVLPFLGGKDPSRVYDGSALIVILITLIGLARLRKRNNNQ